MNILTKTFNTIGRKLVKMTDPSGMLVPSYASSGDKPVLYTSEAVLYYMMCSPVFTSIDKISMEASSIRPLIYNTDTKEFINKHPVLDLLKYPSSNITWSELMYAIAAWYLICGNVYLNADGFIEKIPKTLKIYPAQNSVIIPDAEGNPDIYQARQYVYTDIFKKAEVVNYGRMRLRYYSQTIPNFKEIYHIRTFNPQASSTMVYGLSPLNAVFYDIQQYIQGAKHNLNILQRGSRISGLWSSEKSMTDEQRVRMQQQIDYQMSGAANAGKNILVDGTTVKYQDVLTSNRDMDYVQMRQKVTEGIYTALDIPLPLISEEHMILSNLEGSKAIFYECAVIPLVKRIFEELTSFLMPRYDNENDNLIIYFNENDIPALEPKRNEQAQIKKNIGTFTMNEIRKTYGLEPLVGGNAIYGTISDVPIATDPSDPYSDMEVEKPEQEEIAPTQDQQEETEEEKKASKDKFISTLRRQVNKDGSLRFSEDEILELAGRHYSE